MTTTADHLVRATAQLEYRMIQDAITSGVHAKDAKAFWAWALDHQGAAFKDAVIVLARDDNPAPIKALAALYLAR
jgi:hypothetical protein